MAHTSDASIGGLVRGALDDFRELIREEIALARSELRSPKARLADLQDRVRPENYLGAAAVAAVAVGGGLAVAGWRRVRRESNLVHGVTLEGPMLSDVICE